MKKIFRIFIIIISSAVLLYGVFVGIECVRLYSENESKPPLIITQPTKIQNGEVKYSGLGYTVIYKIKSEIPTEENEISNTIYDICGAEFRLFDKILLWAWIEDSGLEVETFSYEEEFKEYDGIEYGVKRNDFHNIEKIEIKDQTQAEEVAENEVTVEYDSVSVAFDEEAQMWKVSFFKEGQLGGDQTVYLNKDGTTQLCVWGE